MGSRWQCDTCLTVWSRLSEFLPGNSEVFKDVLKTLIVAAIVAALTWLGRKLYKWLKSTFGDDNSLLAEPSGLPPARVLDRIAA